MELQQALVHARIDELNDAANDVRAARGSRRSPADEPGRIRMAVGLWLVDLGMTLVHGSRLPASAQRR
jgi:nucleoside diphosphate kinase